MDCLEHKNTEICTKLINPHYYLSSTKGYRDFLHPYCNNLVLQVLTQQIEPKTKQNHY